MPVWMGFKKTAVTSFQSRGGIHWQELVTMKPNLVAGSLKSGTQKNSKAENDKKIYTVHTKITNDMVNNSSQPANNCLCNQFCSVRLL